MGFYSDRILPRMIDRVMQGPDFDRVRGEVTQGLHGVVLEIGFGSGLNLRHMPQDVTQLLAVDPATLGRELAAERIRACPFPVDFAGLDGQTLDLPDASVDCALSTWNLCTIPDAGSALRELRRVLKPGGALHFVDHGLAPEAGVARWQNRITPVWKRLGGGCHLNRKIDTLVSESGLALDKLRNFYIQGPRPFTYLYTGRAVRSDG